MSFERSFCVSDSLLLGAACPKHCADQEQHEHEEHTDRCHCPAETKIIRKDKEQGYEEKDDGPDSKGRLQCISNDNIGAEPCFCLGLLEDILRKCTHQHLLSSIAQSKAPEQTPSQA